MWIVLGAIVVALFMVHRWFKVKYSYFSSRDIPGPAPHFPDGHFFQMNHNSGSLNIREWTKIYGETYGIFEGTIPVLVTSNLDILHDVFIKKFEYFHGRKVQNRLAEQDHNPGSNVFLSRGQRWKRIRSIWKPGYGIQMESLGKAHDDPFWNHSAAK